MFLLTVYATSSASSPGVTSSLDETKPRAAPPSHDENTITDPLPMSNQLTPTDHILSTRPGSLKSPLRSFLNKRNSEPSLDGRDNPKEEVCEALHKNGIVATPLLVLFLVCDKQLRKPVASAAQGSVARREEFATPCKPLAAEPRRCRYHIQQCLGASSMQ